MSKFGFKDINERSGMANLTRFLLSEISGRRLGYGAFGENINAVTTGPGVRERRNCRVEITISN